MAEYPTVTPTFDTKVDYVTVIFADHVNKLQTELLATQTTLGTGILSSSGWVGSFSTAASTHASVKARLNNIEYGLNEAYSNRVSTFGGSTVQSASTSIVGLKFQALSSQTADMLQFIDETSTTITKVKNDGYIYTSDKKLVPIVYASTQPTGVPAGTIWVDSSSDVNVLSLNGLVPDGGTTGQVLMKNTGTDYDFDWKTVTIPDTGFNPFMLGGM